MKNYWRMTLLYGLPSFILLTFYLHLIKWEKRRHVCFWEVCVCWHTYFLSKHLKFFQRWWSTWVSTIVSYLRWARGRECPPYRHVQWRYRQCLGAVRGPISRKLEMTGGLPGILFRQTLTFTVNWALMRMPKLLVEGKIMYFFYQMFLRQHAGEWSWSLSHGVHKNYPLISQRSKLKSYNYKSLGRKWV